jgi:hypothetical protein
MSYDSSFTGTDYNFDFGTGTGVKMLLLGDNLAGTASDYVGKSYQLVLDQKGAIGTNLAQANVPDQNWTINGKLFLVHFDISTFASTGTVTVGSITSVPEPSAAGVVIGSVAVAMLRHSRRRRGRLHEINSQ